jgi:hypothetical protein
MEVFWKLWALGVQDDSTPAQICKGQKWASYPQSIRFCYWVCFSNFRKRRAEKNSRLDQAEFCVSRTKGSARLGSSEMTSLVEKRLQRSPKVEKMWITNTRS